MINPSYQAMADMLASEIAEMRNLGFQSVNDLMMSFKAKTPATRLITGKDGVAYRFTYEPPKTSKPEDNGRLSWVRDFPKV